MESNSSISCSAEKSLISSPGIGPPLALLTRGRTRLDFRIPIFAHDQLQSIFDKRGEGAAFRGGFASRAAEESLGKSD